MQYVIGIDVGGTKISLVLANLKGKIYAKQTLVTKTGTCARQSIDELISAVNVMIAQRKSGDMFRGIGFCVPGAIDMKEGVITKSPNLPGWTGIQIKKILKQAFHVPVFLDNDANVACFGEKVFGAGKDFDTFLYVTISTGIGAGVVANNMMVHGMGGYAGEIGHMVVRPNGRQCNCGKRGCLEAHASGTAIAKAAQAQLSQLSPSEREKRKLFKAVNGNMTNLNAAVVARVARSGDQYACAIFDNMGYDLGIGFSTILHILNPEAIIIGGSVTKAYSLFAASMRRALEEYTWVPVRKCKIIRSKLGDSVADLGAVALVIDNLRL